jgi:acyl carrier protein
MHGNIYERRLSGIFWWLTHRAQKNLKMALHLPRKPMEKNGVLRSMSASNVGPASPVMKTALDAIRVLNPTAVPLPESNLKTDLGLDSLDGLEMVMAMEDRFNVEVTEDEWDDVRTLGQMVDLIESKMK